MQSGPYGAVKERSISLYVQIHGEEVLITFGPSFTGESGGFPRYMTSPDLNVEDFRRQTVDFLFVRIMST